MDFRIVGRPFCVRALEGWGVSLTSYAYFEIVRRTWQLVVQLLRTENRMPIMSTPCFIPGPREDRRLLEESPDGE